MLSLDNTYNEEDLRDFDTRVKNLLPELRWSDIEYVIEYKFDGLSLRVSYEDWILKEAVTRWNWEVWEDVTENAKMIKNLPQTILSSGYFEVRWEVMMYNSDFEEVNKERVKNWEQIFANPRNAASGSLRQKDPTVTKSRRLAFFGYDTPMFEGDKTHIERTKHLEDLGFTTESDHILCKSIDEVISHIESIWNKKWSFPFEIDGLVLKVNETKYWDRLGLTAHHPRWAIAYKFPAETVSTKLLSVEHSVWRTGTITPVANLEAVNIWWVVVRRATLHNYEEVLEKGVLVWDYVFVRRAWEVIPEVLWPIESQRTGDEEPILPPELCPVCDNHTKKDEAKVRYYCDNPLCPVQVKERLAYSVWKTALNIDGMGPSIVKKFINEGLITDIVSIFELEDKKEQILSLEWFKEKSVNNLLDAINTARSMEVSTLLVALWISGIWKKTSKEIAKLFKSKEDFLEFKYTFEDLENLPDIGPELAKNIKEFFTLEKNKELLGRLLEVVNLAYPDSDESPKTWFFLDKKVCITWSFDGYSRDELAKIVEDLGGEFVTSVSKKTDYLLAWEKAWSKKTKAESLWVEVIDLNFVLDKINS